MIGASKTVVLAGVVAVVVIAGILISYPGIVPDYSDTDSQVETASPVVEVEENIQVSEDGGDSMEDVGAPAAEGEQIEVTAEGTAEVTPASGKEVIIEMSSSGFSPSSVTINVGDTVTFLSTDDKIRWPASAFHPTHTAYPGSGINKCDSGEVIFDSCGGVGKGESFSFTFNEAGTWGYHDHLQSVVFGSVTVQ